jgi:rhodanese-related sulfurtransferase
MYYIRPSKIEGHAMTIPQLSVSEVAAMYSSQSDFVFLDVREHEELVLASIEGATHIPLGEIPSQLPTLDPEKEYVIFCHHGVRSQNVAHFLKQQDFDNVKNMRGGIDAWSMQIDSGVPRY